MLLSAKITQKQCFSLALKLLNITFPLSAKIVQWNSGLKRLSHVGKFTKAGKFTKLYQRLSTKFSSTLNRCFFHFNLNCQFRETDRQPKRLCNLHYRLLTLSSLDDYYTAAYKENYGNCPQCISLLTDLNFSSI